jgi:hypothetical protein
LNAVPGERRATLIAKAECGASSLSFDIILQGAGETVFLDV